MKKESMGIFIHMIKKHKQNIDTWIPDGRGRWIGNKKPTRRQTRGAGKTPPTDTPAGGIPQLLVCGWV